MALVEANVEGTIDDITSDGAAGAIITVMTAGASRLTIHYTPGPMLTVPPPVPPTRVRQKSIKTPSQRLIVAQLIFNSSLPGRPTFEGFEGGTIVAEGFYRTDPDPAPVHPALVANFFIANHISVEPAETVLIGAVTGNNGTTIQVNTVNIVPLTDSRLSTNPAAPATPVYLNDSGFEITLASIALTPTAPNLPPPVAAPPASSVLGYFSNGNMHAYLIEYGARGLLAPLAGLPPQHPRISIERANVRDLGTTFDIEIRGHVTAPPPLTQADHQIEVRVMDMKPGTFGTLVTDWVYRGSEAVSEITRALTLRMIQRGVGGGPVALDPPIQQFRFRGNIPKTGVHDLVPERIEVRNATAEASIAASIPGVVPPQKFVRAVADTDVRDA